MTEALVQFQEKITRKALRHFEDHGAVNFEDFHKFVNDKMGTEFQDNFVREVFEYFTKERNKSGKIFR